MRSSVLEEKKACSDSVDSYQGIPLGGGKVIE